MCAQIQTALTELNNNAMVFASISTLFRSVKRGGEFTENFGCSQ